MGCEVKIIKENTVCEVRFGLPYSTLSDSDRVIRRMQIHYDPQRPGDTVPGQLTPPWILLVIGLGFSGFLMFDAYQFR